MAAHLPNYPRLGFSPVIPSRRDLQRIEPVNLAPERFYLPRYRLSARELGIMRSLYEGEVAYLDAKIGAAVALLRDLGILDDTILILTSDHGENFGDHGLIEHQFCLYDSLLHVPLVIRYPRGIQAGTRVTRRVSTIFLFRTIVDWVGGRFDGSLRGLEGRSLFGDHDDQRIYAEYDNPVEVLREAIGPEAPEFDFERVNRTMASIHDGGYKYIWSSNGREELFDLDRDSDERHDLVSIELPRSAELNGELKAWRSSLGVSAGDLNAPPIDDDTRNALKSLGYAR